MKLIKKKLINLAILGFLSLPSIVNAHAMVAQHGTLNFVNNSVFLMLSMPISAFSGIDDNKDGNISMVEFNLHRKKISRDVKESVYLTAVKDKLLIDGLLLNPSISHIKGKDNIDQITVMGRYLLPDVLMEVNFNVKLFGKTAPLKTYDITATNKKQGLTKQFDITSGIPSMQVFRK